MRKVLNLIITFCFINLILLIIFSWKWADDFGLYNRYRAAGNLISYLYNGYMTHDGRFFSPIAFLQGIFISIHNAPLGISFYLSNFLLSIYLLLKILENIKIFSTSIYEKLISMIFIFWGMREILNENVFWLTGGVYSVSLLLLIFWFYLLSKIEWRTQRNSNRKFRVIAIMTCLAALNGPNHVALMFSAVIIIAINQFKHSNYNKSFLIKIGFLLFIILLFSLPAILAPGNNSRINLVTATSGLELLNPKSLLHNLIFVLSNYIPFTKYPIFALLILMIPISLRDTRSFDEVKTAYLSNIIPIVGFLVLALTSIIPFIIYPGFAVPRTSLLFLVFLILFLTPNIFLIYKKLIFYFNIKFCEKHTFLVLILISLPLALVLSSWSIRSYKAKRIMASRYEKLESERNSNSNEEINIVKLNLPIIRKFDPIQSDSSHYINHDFSKFYGFKTLTGIPDNSKFLDNH